MRPYLLRPPERFSGSTRLFSGSLFVISSKAETDMKRRPGDVGLYLRRAIRPALLRRSRSTRPRAAARSPSSSRASCRGPSHGASASPASGRCSRPRRARGRTPRPPAGPASCEPPGGHGTSTCARRSSCSSSPRPQARAEPRSDASSLRPPLHLLERGLDDQERARPDELLHLELARQRHEDAVEVAERLDHALVLGSGDDEQGQLLPPGPEEL